jgi:hypothetical protein
MTSSAVRTMTPEEEATWVEDRLVGKPITEKRGGSRTLTDRVFDVLKDGDWHSAHDVLAALQQREASPAVAYQVSTRMSQLWAEGHLERASTKERGLYLYRRAP